ncbi:MAG: DUF58 domain-containing protein [Cyclobacteriaceae bacterium]|nr:DUF58 domain-containing protein [Cyclobacteriaceae bacterium]
MLLRLSLYWLSHIVIRWQLLLTLLVLWLGGMWLKANYGQDDSNMWIVMYQFVRIIQWAIVGLFSISLLTALTTWGLFIYNVRQKKISVQVQFGDGQQAEAGYAMLVISLTGTVIRPLLGTIRGRLVFAGKKLSEVILLDTDVFKKRGFLRHAIKGTGRTLLHDRGIYDVEKVHILFYDMFSLIALPCSVPFTQQLYTLPKELRKERVDAQPNSTEEQKHRIEIPRRVEGEYISYKEFESGDNIRRIVWKIYAKSGQLVVRIPETKDPYASHLYFYASFYEGFDLNDGTFDTELLNVYKDKVRNVFEALQKNGYDVRIPQDQEIARLSGMSDKKNELFQITAASWQKGNSPNSYVNVNKAAFVCLSALTPVSEIEMLIKTLPMSVPLVVVRLSDAIASPFKIAVKDIFFRPEKNPVDKLRKPWFVSPLRQRILKNENEIERVLKSRGNAWLVRSIDVTE